MDECKPTRDKTLLSQTEKEIMKEHKRVENKFTWVPADKRTSRFGGPMPPRKQENRHPLLWLAREGNEIYLVNSSEDTLDFVIATSGGFQTVDDDVIVANSKDEYEYKNVKPNDAVKVEEYDGFYDLDYVLHISLKVQSIDIGCLEIISPAKKGGVGETVLLWNTKENGKDVSITTK
jgi:hypothetical protein